VIWVNKRFLQTLSSVKNGKAIFNLLFNFNHSIKNFYWKQSVHFEFNLRVLRLSGIAYANAIIFRLL